MVDPNHAKLVDVSHWNNVQDMARLKNNGHLDGVICKSSDGLDQDPTFQWKIAHAQAAGLFIAAYHFPRPLLDPIQQAQNFVKCCQMTGFNLSMWLDLEWVTGADRQEDWGKMSLQAREDFIHAYFDELTKHYKGAFGVYDNFEFHKELLLGVDLSMYRLWDYDYDKTHLVPLTPPCWNGNWTLWQKCDDDTEPGIIGPDDLDEFNGQASALQDLICVPV